MMMVIIDNLQKDKGLKRQRIKRCFILCHGDVLFSAVGVLKPPGEIY